MKKAIICFLTIAFITGCQSPSSPRTSEQVEVVRLAEDTAVKTYGRIVQTELPLRARLQGNSVWIVEGTLNSELGGTVYVEIRRSDKKVMKITHYR